MNDDLKIMYDLVRRTREVLLEFTESLPNDIYILEHKDFAYGSIRNIHAHVAGCYLYWAGVALGYKREDLIVPDDQITNAKTMRERFEFVDGIVNEALEKFTAPDEPLEFAHRSGPLKVTQRWLLLHPITHEFHHKGQLLALARVLKHPLPGDVDTDLVLPFE